MREKNKVLLTLGLLLLFGSVVSAFVVDVDVVVESVVNWTGSVILGITGSNGEVVYFANGAITGSCDGPSKIWDTNIASGTINFTISELVEDGGDLKMEIGGVDHDINVSTSSYSFPFTALNQKVCLKGILKTTGKIKMTSSDIMVGV